MYKRIMMKKGLCDKKNIYYNCKVIKKIDIKYFYSYTQKPLLLGFKNVVKNDNYIKLSLYVCKIY